MTHFQFDAPELASGRAKRVRRLLGALQIPPTRPGFWILYGSSFSVDLGLCLYFFLYPLFLVEHHFSEHAIGFITSALTAGTLAGTIVVGLLSRRVGIRPLLLGYVILAPLCLAARTQFLAESTQIGFSFLAGTAMSLWFVSFPPVIASLTSENSRGFAFSLFVATGIGSGAIAGIIGGYLPGAIEAIKLSVVHDGIRIVLLIACACISLAAIGVVHMRPHAVSASKSGAPFLSAFLVRFLVALAVWNFAISFFTPFANVYLARQLGLPTGTIGAIYTASQLLQVVAVLAAPFLYRRAGLVAGIAITQLGTALVFFALAHAKDNTSAIGLYLALTAMQWMSGPGVSTLLMNRTLDANRGSAAAMQTVVNLGSQAAAASVAGRAFERFGYSASLTADACVAALAGFLLYTLLSVSVNRPQCVT